LFGSVVNWIVVTGSFTTTATIVIPSGILTNPPYEDTWDFYAKVVVSGE
jgi:hypothetical protein